MCRVLIVAPSLDLEKNVSGVSAVANFIIANNKKCEYVHFQQGKSDGESGTFNRLLRLSRNYRAWEKVVNGNGTAELDGNDNGNVNGNGNQTAELYDNVNVNPNENENQNKNKNKDKNGNVNGNGDGLPFTVYSLASDKDVDVEKVDVEKVDVHVEKVDVEKVDVVHYNFPLDAFSIVRDYFFMRLAHKRGLPMVIHVHGGLYLFKEQMPFFIKGILKEVFFIQDKECVGTAELRGGEGRDSGAVR